MCLSAARRRGLRILLGAAAACLAAGCRPPEEAPEIDLSWTVAPHPPMAGPATFSLTLTDATTGKPLSGAAVRLEADMSHAGMEPVFAAAREVGPGLYEAPLELTMAGDWLVLVDATLRDGRTLQRRLELRGVRARGKP
ncbi:MAG TPA: FixH family protein [Thermoanaerobaculia bacterium]|nr:FixH family protein [Thermoanaerobaculia bacterium]